MPYPRTDSSIEVLLLSNSNDEYGVELAGKVRAHTNREPRVVEFKSPRRARNIPNLNSGVVKYNPPVAEKKVIAYLEMKTHLSYLSSPRHGLMVTRKCKLER